MPSAVTNTAVKYNYCYHQQVCFPRTSLSASAELSHFNHPKSRCNYYPTLQRRKQSHRKANLLAKGHTAARGRVGHRTKPSAPRPQPPSGGRPPESHHLTGADQLANELLLHADVDGQLPDLLLRLGQTPLRGRGSWGLAGSSQGLAPTNSCNKPTVKATAPRNSVGGGGGGKARPGQGQRGMMCAPSRTATAGPWRGRSEPSLHLTQLTSGPRDGCTQFFKVKLWALAVAWAPWAGPHTLAPLADAVSGRQRQESVPLLARGRRSPWAFYPLRVNGTSGRRSGRTKPRGWAQGATDCWGPLKAQ